MPLSEFLNRFRTVENCRDYLAAQRWQDGFICPNAGTSMAATCPTVCTSVPTATIRPPSLPGRFCITAMSA